MVSLITGEALKAWVLLGLIVATACSSGVETDRSGQEASSEAATTAVCDQMSQTYGVIDFPALQEGIVSGTEREAIQQIRANINRLHENALASENESLIEPASKLKSTFDAAYESAPDDAAMLLDATDPESTGSQLGALIEVCRGLGKWHPEAATEG
jgi:hypothetical protein